VGRRDNIQAGQTGRNSSVGNQGSASRQVDMLLGPTDRRARGVEEDRKAVLHDFHRKGLRGGFWAAITVYEPFAIGELLKDLRCAG